jgi:hypothetical protein
MSTANVTQTGQAATVAVTVSRGLQGATGATGAQGTTDYNELENVPSEFPPESHTHAVSDIVSISSHRLLGRHAGGSGAGQEVTVGNGLEFHGNGIRRSALTGDVTASAGSNSTTIANDAVTNAKLANVATATIKGRITAGTGDPEDLTPAQALEVIGAATPASVATQIEAYNETRSLTSGRLAAYGHNLRPVFSAMETAFAHGASGEFVVIGDSTANGDDEWFELFADEVRTRFPNHRHVKRVINTTTHEWTETVLNAADGENYLLWGNTAAAFANYGVNAVPGFSGATPFTITMKIRVTDWDANAPKNLIKRYINSDSRQWYVRMNSGGGLGFFWFDGSVTLRNLTISTDIDVTDDTDFWLQIVWVPDNGAGQAQLIVRKRVGDTGAFTDVETKVGTFGTSTLRVPATTESIFLGDSNLPSPLRIYKAWIQEGDAGKIISPYFIDAAFFKLDANGPTLHGSPTLLTSNHSRSGNASNNLLVQLTGDENADRMYANTENCVCFINLGLNDSNSGAPTTTKDQIPIIEDIVELHQGRCPSASYVIIGQNPDNRSSGFDLHHANRISGLFRWALRNNHSFADFNSAMLADPRPIADLLDDGIVHPTTAAAEEILVPVLWENWPRNP